MPTPKELAIEELRRRGFETSSAQQGNNIEQSKITKKDLAIEELRRRQSQPENESGIPSQIGGIPVIPEEASLGFLGRSAYSIPSLPSSRRKILEKLVGAENVVADENNDLYVRRGNSLFPVNEPGFSAADVADLVASTTESIPKALGFAGGGVPGYLLAGALGSAGRQALSSGVQSILDVDQEAKPLERLKDIGIGAITNLGGEYVEKGVKSVLPKILPKKEILPSGLKENADEIISAARSLDVEPTRGMITASPIEQGIESSLEQSPTIPGYLVSKKKEKVVQAVQDKIEELAKDRGSLSKFELGESIKESFLRKAGETSGPAELIYGELQTTFDKAKVSDRVKTIARNRILKSDVARLTKSALPEQIADQISAVKNVSDARKLRTIFRKSKNPTMSEFENDMYNEAISSMDRLITNSISSGKGPEIRNPIARKNVKNLLSEANKAYRKTFKDFGPAAEALGGKSKAKTLPRLLAKIEETPSDQFAQKLFKTNDTKFLNNLKEQFPEEFELLKNQYVGELYEKSIRKIGGDRDISPQAFLRNIRAIPKETKIAIWGNDFPNIQKQLETVIDALPERIGPSGTPKGIEFTKIVSPILQISAFGRYLLLNKDIAGQYVKEKARSAIKSGVRSVTSKPVIRTITRGNINSVDKQNPKKRINSLRDLTK